MGDSLAQVSTWIYLKAWKTNPRSERSVDNGRSVDLVLNDKKVRWAFRRADQLGAARLVLLAPDEWAAGQVRIKTLSTGVEQNVPLDQLTETSRA